MVSPGKGGLGTFAPRVDAAGNSVKGQLAAAFLSRQLGLDLFASAQSGLGARSGAPQGIDPVKTGAVSSQLLTPGRYHLEVSRPTQRRRRFHALVLAAVAIGLVVVEPFPKAKVLFSLTPTHGVDVGDLPALALLLIAACLAI
jgi:Glutaminase